MAVVVVEEDAAVEEFLATSGDEDLCAKGVCPGIEEAESTGELGCAGLGEG